MGEVGMAREDDQAPEPAEGSDIEVTTELDIQATLVARIEREAPELFQDSDSVMALIVEDILEAQTVEDVDGTPAVDPDDILGRPFRIEGFRMQPGDFGMYAAIRGRLLDSGDRVVVTCGGARLLAQLFQYHRLGAFPLVRGLARADTRRGFRTYWLERIPGNIYEGAPA